MLLAAPAVEEIGEARVEIDLDDDRHRDERDDQRLGDDLLALEGEEQHDHDDFVTFIVSLGGTQEKTGLLTRIEDTIAKHDILRLKGFVDVAGSPARLLVQAVGPRLNSYFDRPWKAGERRGTELVVIGEKHMDREAIAAMLRG